MFMLRSSILSAAAMLLATTAAPAATMTFANLPDEGAQLLSYSENGIKAKAFGGVVAYEGMPGYAHLDDSGTGLATGLDFTTGGLFDAASFDLVSWGYNFWFPPGPLSDNIAVTGFLNGSVVSQASFILSDIAGTLQSFALGSGFAGIDKFRIELLYPVNIAMCDAPCGHLDLDSVTFNGVGPALVPLPAGGLLVGTGMIALMGTGRRRRAKA